MKLAELNPGDEVVVTRGYSRRPAVVREILPEGRVHVSYVLTAAERAAIARTPSGSRGAVFGAVVRPAQIQKKSARNA